MSKKNDGGSAFPESYIGADMPHAGIGNGMTLRDYFAAKAMVGFMTMVSGSTHTIESDEHLAAQAYKLTDAMLKERDK